MLRRWLDTLIIIWEYDWIPSVLIFPKVFSVRSVICLWEECTECLFATVPFFSGFEFPFRTLLQSTGSWLPSLHTWLLVGQILPKMSRRVESHWPSLIKTGPLFCLEWSRHTVTDVLLSKQSSKPGWFVVGMWIYSGFCFLVQVKTLALPKTNIAPENGWLEDDRFPFGIASWQVLC